MESRVESRVKHVFDGLSLVALGLVFLGMTLGLIEWSVLLNVISLWPLLIVVAGIDLIGKSMDSGWVRAISSLVFIGGLAYAVFVMPADGWPGTLGIGLRRGDAVTFEGDAGDAAPFAEASARIGSAVGRLDIEARGGAELLSYEGRSRYGEPDLEVSEEGSRAVVTLEFGDAPGFTFGPTRGDRLGLALNRDVLWALRIDSGVGELNADLSDLELARLELDSGIGTGTIRLGEPTETSEVRLESGIASVKLLMPEDAQARVRLQSGIGSKDLPEGFERTDDGAWETDGYVAGEPAWNVVVQSGIGNLEIDTY